jgi:hypothetical protein
MPASTAASASPLCRFKVETGIAILEGASFTYEFSEPSNLPVPEHLDAAHRAWRDCLIREAGVRNVNFTHGVAAKLANTYLKVRFVCGGHHEHEHVACLHPPIDRVLLTGLADGNVGGFSREWLLFRQWGWSSYTSEQYQEVIDHIRCAIPDRPLWEIEQYWRGHQ